ncbi:MAG: C39 family peptidase [Candidatus Aureabacteria bacterium]|nr:C39 family peptidase [Candidatus Auribacterota bacterium]
MNKILLIALLILTIYSPLPVFAVSKKLDVPFVEQKKNYCGPASISMLFNYYDKNISQDEVAKHIYNPKIKGTLSIDLLLFVRNLDFYSEIYSSSIQDLKKKIDEGFPVIVMTKGDPNNSWSFFKNYHFFVIYGYDDKKNIFYCHSEDMKASELPFKKLLGAWKETNCCAFIIYPRHEKKN